jgi:tRNA(Ile)-lysidine synthetase-like protein
MKDPFIPIACRGLAALQPPARVLLAVSGGADSMALLDALWAGRTRRDLRAVSCAVGHFDHRLRADSARDLELVRQAALARGIPFVFRVAEAITAGGRGLEEAARTARYSALVGMAAEVSAAAIVTAHTATDQAETLLWRLARGAGRRGAGGMRPRRRLPPLLLLRPLLGVTREETRAYCARRSIPFHDDPSNEDHRPRARVRSEVLPVLERLAPGATVRLAAAAERFRAEDDWLDREAHRRGGDLSNASRLARLPVVLRRRALLQWAAERLATRRRLSSTHIHMLENLVLAGSGEVELPSAGPTRSVAVLRDGQLVLEHRATPLRER